jgi:multidrug transporter EmrE-like cation transporter
MMINLEKVNYYPNQEKEKNMSNANLTRWSGLSLLLAGIANALFWLLVIPIGTFAGAGAVQNSLWLPSQFLHTLAALLALFGLIGLYTYQGDKNGWLGLTGLVLALFGTGFALADAVIALVVYPIAAASAPALVEATGALNMSPAYIVFSVISMVGTILFGIALLLQGRLPRLALSLLILGAILVNLPPGVVPMLVLIAGGVVWGLGAAWLGFALWSARTDKAT